MDSLFIEDLKLGGYAMIRVEQFDLNKGVTKLLTLSKQVFLILSSFKVQKVW